MTAHGKSIDDTGRREGIYHGWFVVAAVFLIAMFGWGIGFYGPGIFLKALTVRHGWAVDGISWSITLYYLISATLIFGAGRIVGRFGVRRVVLTAVLSLAGAIALLALATQKWHVFACFALMAVGWAGMSGAAVNIIIAPWFEKRRGLAISLGLNGAAVGGIVMAPLLIRLIERAGFDAVLPVLAVTVLLVLLPAVSAVLRPKRVGESDKADAAAPDVVAAGPARGDEPWQLRQVIRSTSFCTISIPFALGLLAQVGFLTHQVSFLTPPFGVERTGWAVSLTTFAAVFGRFVTGFFVDRVNRRLVSGLNFFVQAIGLFVLAMASTPFTIFIGCVFFGLAVGNMIALPGLIVQQEFPKQHFARIIGLIVGINQFVFAFGPGLLGYLFRIAGDYSLALLTCTLLQVIAATIVIGPFIVRSRK